MNKFFLSLVAATALAFAGTPGQAKASWLSQALHTYLDGPSVNPYVYPAPGYPAYPVPAYPYASGYTSAYTPGYTYYPPTVVVPSPVPGRFDPPGFGPGYVNPYWQWRHAMHEQREQRWRTQRAWDAYWGRRW